jgi:sarcosine oxidase delta subunit
LFYRGCGQIQGCNNWYNYACDIRTDNFVQLGGGSQMNCNDVTQGALFDRLLPCTTGHCHPCHHRVALVLAPDFDYYWYRQDTDGSWSHNRGCTAATNVDESNNPISDPSLADRGPYTDFCGYFCVYKPDVKIGGPGCACWP